MRPLVALTAAFLLGVLPALAQTDGLTIGPTEITEQADDFGQTISVIEGQLLNSGPDAYSDVTLFASLYDADGELVGEGIGYPVNACGAGLLPGAAIQPDTTHQFAIRLDLYDPTAQVEAYEVVPQAIPAAATAINANAIPAIHQVSADEVVEVEWIDNRALRYGVGCNRDDFHELNWTHYSLRTGVGLAANHPHAADITEDLYLDLGLDEPALVDPAQIRFAPNGNRLLFQAVANLFTTAQVDGSFRRTLADDVYNRTLQGIIWLDETRFVAYYYGAYGEPVLYFSGDAGGTRISLPPTLNLPSQIVPGVSPDGRRAVIAGTFADETGYFLKSIVSNGEPQLLFAAEPPGNNWPPPLFVVDPSDNGQPSSEMVYVARPVDGAPRLQCFNLQTGALHDLSALPLALTTEEEARWWLSPDARTIALAANGTNGGLWLIDLTQLPACA